MKLSWIAILGMMMTQAALAGSQLENQVATTLNIDEDSARTIVQALSQTLPQLDDATVLKRLLSEQIQFNDLDRHALSRLRDEIRIVSNQVVSVGGSII